MRVFLLNGAKLSDAARIAAQCCDPWASEVFCSPEDWHRELWSTRVRKLPILNSNREAFEPYEGVDVAFCVTLAPDDDVPQGQIHVLIPTPPNYLDTQAPKP